MVILPPNKCVPVFKITNIQNPFHASKEYKASSCVPSYYLYDSVNVQQLSTDAVVTEPVQMVKVPLIQHTAA